MKRKIFLLLLSIVAIGMHMLAQPIIINELYNSNENYEWIELLVIQDGLDLRGWDIRDYSISGAPQTPLVFSTNILWNNLKSGTLIVIARPENTFAEDLDASDYTLTIKSNNTTYFSGNVFSLAGISDAVQIRDSSQNHKFGVSWGSANATSLPSPKVHFSGTSTSNTSTAFKGNSLTQLTDVVNWLQNTTTITRGTGNTTENSAWISALRARPEGSGSVSVIPTVANGDIDTVIKITYRIDPAFTVNNLRIIIPSQFIWSQNVSDINFEGMTATVNISGDTIYFTNATIIDSTIITILNVHTPIYTGYYKLKVQSGLNGTYGDVLPVQVITIYGAPIPINEAKVNDVNGVSLRIGDLVTIRGIITVANEFGSPSFIQDNTSGMSIYGPIFSGSVNIGDEVLVSGKITQFNGLNQIEYPTLHGIISSGNNVEPTLTTPTALNSDGAGGIENFEGKLIQLKEVSVTNLNGTPVNIWTANTNYRLIGKSNADTVQLRIDNNTDLVGQPAPAGVFDVIGVLGQYKTSSPFIGGYQLMPRSKSDIISSGPIITYFPEETYIDSNSITVYWRTLYPGTSRIKYGKTLSYELGVTGNDETLTTEHTVNVTGLTPATIYNFQAFSVSGTDTSFAGNLIVSTTSASPTTGKINVYFNKSVNTSVSIGQNASGNINFVNKILDRINNAKYSIDAALYNMSGSVGATIASSLVNAKNRGVKVRVVAEYDSRNNAPFSTLTSNGIPVLYDFSGANDGTGLMHNKFFVFDYRGGAPDSIWVWTGSWNPTDPGTNDDRQNIIEIQDVALAATFTREFEEMFGTSTDLPNPANARFGSRKINNTPHKFYIGGKYTECYFSPSDKTSRAIAKTIGKSQKSVNIAMLSFTWKEFADSLINNKNKGNKVRVIMDNNTDTGNQFSYLLTNGIDVRLKSGSGLLHHKYAIIDAEPFGYTSWLITGSHNWTSSAENRNDENTLLIKDNIIANLYLQEFSARYYEAGGEDSIRVSVHENRNQIPESYYLSQNYPNPFNPSTTIDFSLPVSVLVTLKIYNVLGQEIAELLNSEMKAGNYSLTFDASKLSSGMYFYKLNAGNFTEVKKMLFVK